MSDLDLHDPVPPALHVALVADEAMLLEESPGLVRTGVGLMGDGIRLDRVLPDHAGPGALAALDLARRIDVAFRPPLWLRRRRRHRLAAAFGRDPLDAVLARGLRAAPVAGDLASVTGAALVLEAWSPEEAQAATRINRHHPAAAIAVPTNALADDLRRRVDPGIVAVVPAGVPVPSAPRTVFADAHPDAPALGAAAIAVIGEGRDPAAWRAMFEGLRRVLEVPDDRRPPLHLFAEIRGPHGHEAWRDARRCDLLDAVSSIERASDHRRLLLAADLLVVPERLGRLRSIHLEAMAHGIPVIAGDDPWLEMHEDGITAAVVPGEDPAAWAEALRGLLLDPERARGLGAAGRERVAASHRSSDRVHRLRRLLDRATTGGTHRITPGAP